MSVSELCATEEHWGRAVTSRGHGQSRILEQSHLLGGSKQKWQNQRLNSGLEKNKKKIKKNHEETEEPALQLPAVVEDDRQVGATIKGDSAVGSMSMETSRKLKSALVKLEWLPKEKGPLTRQKLMQAHLVLL